MVKHARAVASATVLGWRDSQVVGTIWMAFLTLPACRALPIAEPRRGYAHYPEKEGSVVRPKPRNLIKKCSSSRTRNSGDVCAGDTAIVHQKNTFPFY